MLVNFKHGDGVDSEIERVSKTETEREKGLPLSCNAQDQLQQFTKPTAWLGRLKCYQAFNNYRIISGLSPCSVQLHAKCKYVCVSNCARVT